MPPSQLKRLKSSLREQGITGPQKSKKQKKSAAHSKTADARIRRNVALQQIRDSFNPFELRPASRPAKFESVSRDGIKKSYRDVLHRPGVTKSAGEDARRATLLPELQRRNKVGGLVDRRIGEGDADMTAEERALQRFAREKSRKRSGTLFDLEASDDEIGGGEGLLTHGGRSIMDLRADDFQDDVAELSGSESEDGFVRRKRRRSDADEDGAKSNIASSQTDADSQPDRKKSKNEVMKEVIAKSKLHKYERQKVREDDDELREELDAGVQDILAALKGQSSRPVVSKSMEPALNGDAPIINADRQMLIDGLDRKKADKEYDARIRQLAQDSRAKPSERARTTEERDAAEAERLKELEERRMKRMLGEPMSEDEGAALEHNKSEPQEDSAVMEEEDIPNEAADFGFAISAAQPLNAHKMDQLVLEDEDEFDVDEDLVASASDINLSDSESAEGSEDSSISGLAAEEERDQGEEDEFVNGILGTGATNANNVELGSGQANGGSAKHSSKLSYTYPCPRSHSEFLDLVQNTPLADISTIIQRIRALHHPSLSSSNKEAMADFSSSLVTHLGYMGMQRQSLSVIEQVIRHLHSLSRTYSIEIATTFRQQLGQSLDRAVPNRGDLVHLIAIGAIYPTSDHFHQVVTPAVTLMARYLALTEPKADSPETLAAGAYMVAMCLRYQSLSRRYVPEAVRFTLKTLHIKPPMDSETLQPHIDNVIAMADLWRDKSAFTEIFTPFLQLLKIHQAKKSTEYLQVLLAQAKVRRQPLVLHNHKPLPLRASIPKFEEAFNPDKHYDPDKERSDTKKLQKEYKRERKGALRELRKDANFVAREQLREKKEKDAEYERKYRRLVAEVQGEEGHAAKEYGREKERRKKSR